MDPPLGLCPRTPQFHSETMFSVFTHPLTQEQEAIVYPEVSNALQMSSLGAFN